MKTPPNAPKIPHEIQLHGETWIDDYHWMREKTRPEVTRHLEAENAYTDSVLASLNPLREKIFNELKGRLKEDDAGVPHRRGDYFYYSRMIPGKQYGVHCRKYRSLDAPEQILLDGNAVAEGKPYFALGVFEVSPDHRWLAYSVDFDGSERYIIHFKNLETDQLSAEVIPGSAHSLEWAADNRTVFYTMLDEHERPDRILRHVVGTSPDQDVLIHKEEDAQLFVYCGKSKSGEFIWIDIHGKVTSEVHFLASHDPTGGFRVIEPRRRGVLYSVVHHGETFFLLTNDLAQNFRLVEAPIQDPGASNWREVRPGNPEIFLEDIEAFKNYLVLSERQEGLTQLRIVDLTTNEEHLVEFPEPCYDVGTHSNYEFDSEKIRFTYTSLVTPSTVLDYDMGTRAREVKKIQEVPSGYDPKLYESRRIFAPSRDGVRIPISLVYRKDLVRRDGTTPLYLYGYGSYGISIDATFGTSRLSLLDRGFVFAIAHVRGGSEMGRAWYEEAKFLKKKTTFSDFISVAEFLIREKFTTDGQIVICGGSAVGMLVGQVLNERPELFRAAIAKVPFVDVVNTMLDESLPLTVTEFEEWGNPKDPVYFRYMREYSPYDNVRRQAYPHLLVTSGLNDPRVTYWEPAKWVAKLRELKTDSHLLLQHINMEAGHGGASGRYEALKEIALEYVFILKVFGTKEATDLKT